MVFYRYKAKPAGPFLFCVILLISYTTSQAVKCPNQIVGVVSCCDVTHRRNGHIGLACTGCNPVTRTTARGPSLEPRPGG